MNPIQFAEKLKDAAPSELDLSRCGLSAAEAKAFVHSFICVPRGDAILRDLFSEPLLDLVQNWEASRLEIGMVCFRDQPVVLHGDYCVGSVESDPIVICRESGEVVVKSAFDPWQVLWVAAKDGSGFLDALSMAA
ncbi:MAG: hypothetical protein NT069_13565, partial [Planctomycetota bacterium]|nr:hypothetical protein [Planctomycetota bacterium]